MAALSSFHFPGSLQSPPKCKDICPPVCQGEVAHPLPRLPQPGRRNNAVTYISQHLLEPINMHGDLLIFPPSLPLPSSLSRLSSPPLPSIRNSFRRPLPPPTAGSHSAEPLSPKPRLTSTLWNALH